MTFRLFIFDICCIYFVKSSIRQKLIQHLNYFIGNDPKLFHKVRQEYMKAFEVDYCMTKTFEALDKIRVKNVK